jgi:1-aminocyclopropane-1-carboxylate deaminase/D-cysteine desulfhydrase-like pyridoxal-dependent ACC family enzyme
MRVPEPIARLPRFALLDGPSPFHRLERFSAALGGHVEVWIKREDLLPLAFGGNKLRNLEFLVGAAVADGADTLVTSGRRWSNHCRLTAAAGARARLGVHLVLSGPRPHPGDEGPGQELDELLGAHLHWTAAADRAERADLVERVAGDVRARGGHPFVIEVGGSGPVGAAGQVIAGLELAEQLHAGGIGAASVVVPSATGGTQAGLVHGLLLASPPDRAVIGIAVGAPTAELEPKVRGLSDALASLTGVRPAADALVLENDQLGGGYGVRSARADEAMRLLATTEGILVDPIYTAKALAGLVARARDGRLEGPVVFWHAGGTPGLFERLES